MHYKTTSLSDSVIGRAFVKEALDKGLIEAPEAPSSHVSVTDAFTKLEALRPDENLTSNILKLCQGLRQQGLVSYAETLEQKFLQVKQAGALYDVSGEKGEDLINSAHPEGSHDMKDVEGDATIETILDRAKKMQEVVSKMPTGKLAAKDAVNVARVILAQQATKTEAQWKADVKKNLTAYKYLYTRIKELTDRDLTFMKMPDSDRIDATINAPGVDNLEEEKTFIENMQFNMKPSGIWGRVFFNWLGIGEVSKNTWDVVKGALNKCLEYINNAKDAQDQVNSIKSQHLEQSKPLDSGTDADETESGAPVAPKASPAYIKAAAAVQDSLATLNDWKPTVNTFADVEDRVAGLKWITDTEAALHQLLTGTSPQAETATLNVTILPSLQKIEKDMIDFYNAWIKE